MRSATLGHNIGLLAEIQTTLRPHAKCKKHHTHPERTTRGCACYHGQEHAQWHCSQARVSLHRIVLV